MNDYKRHVRGERGLVALADDYLKFIRLSQHLLDSTELGVWGMITNHGFLKGVIHRGVRKELLDQFSAMFFLDLHGDSNIGERAPEDTENENVFDIQQGVAITIASRIHGSRPYSSVLHRHVWGSRSDKSNVLASHTASSLDWTPLQPRDPRYLFVPFDDKNLDEYQAFPALDDLMPVNSCGVKTHRDAVVIDFDRKTLASRMLDIASECDLERLRALYGIKDTKHWSLEGAKTKIKASEVEDFIQPITYRPFDFRWIYYNRDIIEKGDSKYPTLRHMLSDNLALLSARIQATGVFDAVFVSRYLAEMKTGESSRSCTVFPLFLIADHDTKQRKFSQDDRTPNLNTEILLEWARMLGAELDGAFGLPRTLTAEDILQYIYSVLHSPGYRRRYAEFLRIGFPRLPLTGDIDLVRELSRLGRELIRLHLMVAPRPANPVAQFVGSPGCKISKVSWSDDTVWLDAKEANGFQGIREDVWSFCVGGYQVCHKWLKDRKGRTLSEDDIAHYQAIVDALSESLRLMQEIDEVIERHGGWPAAFQIDGGQGSVDNQALRVAERRQDYD